MMTKVRILGFFYRVQDHLVRHKDILGVGEKVLYLDKCVSYMVPAFVQAHKIVHVRFGHFTLCTFYLKKF